MITMIWDSVLWICTAAALFSGYAHSLPTQLGATRPVQVKECNVGPSYWCTNFTTSSQCNADVYCISTIWEHTVPSPDNGRICKTCKNMVEQAREVMRSNEKQENNIKLVLEGSCLTMIPNKPLAHECLKLVDQAIPQLIKALSSQMNPQMVCATTGLCNSFRLDNMVAMYKLQPSFPVLPVEIVNTLQYDQSSSVHKPPSHKPNGLHSIPLVSSGDFMNEILNATKDKKVDSEICEMCELALQTVQKGLQNKEIQAVIREIIEQVCLIAPSPIRPQCKQSVDKYSDSFITLVVQSINPSQMCQYLRLCPLTGLNLQYIEIMNEILNATKDKKVDSEICEMCELALQTVQKGLQNKEIQAVIREIIEQVCLIAPSPIRPQCKQSVDKYSDSFITLVVQSINPSQMCQYLRLCPLTGLNLQYIEINNEILNGNKEKKVDSVICGLCELALQTVQEGLQNNEIQAVIREATEQVCLIMPSPFRPQCKQYVDMYCNLFLTLAVQIINPSQMCQVFRVCPSTGLNLQYIEIMNEILNANKDKKVASETCELCELTLKTVQKDLQNKEIQAVIRETMEQICLIVPSHIRPQCKQSVDKYCDLFMTLLVQSINPSQMCQLLRLCPSTGLNLQYNEIMNEILNANKDKKVASETCELCELTLKTVQKDLQNKEIQAVIREIMEQVCLIVPWPIRPQCKQSVDTYCDLFMTFVVPLINPSQMCQVFRLCPWTGLNLQYNEIMKDILNANKDKKVDSETCELCELTLKTVKKDLQNKEIQAVIRETMEQVCLIAPSPIRPQCKQSVDTYCDLFMTLVVPLINPSQICQLLRLCPLTGLNLQYNETVNSGSLSLQVSEAQLPLDSLVVVPEDKDLCQMCNYFLHFLQDELTNPINEQTIIETAEQACDGLPDKFSPMCRSFVDTYAKAGIALLAQGIDPSKICPKFGVCPGLLEAPFGCDLCKTTAVQFTRYFAGSNTSKPSLKKQLMTLCLSLPFHESQDCSRLLYTHREDLLDMLTADFTGEEICFYMQYCKATPSPQAVVGGDVENQVLPEKWRLADKPSKKSKIHYKPFLF